MRKNNTNPLMTMNFRRACIANLLFFVATYMLLPVLPFALSAQAGVGVGRFSGVYLLLLFSSLAVGLFNAWLGDTYKRKHVWAFSMLAMLAGMWGLVYADSYVQLLLLTLPMGAGIGLATTAGITVAIDITATSRRSDGNMAFAWMARLGMLLGAGTGVILFRDYGFRTLVPAALAVGLVAVCFALRVYVAFRAPIGLPLLSIDRFFLPRAWLPAVNLLLLAMVPGLLLPLLMLGEYWVLGILALLAVVTVPIIRMFVRLSNHCQRGTANTTCMVSVETGLLLGMAVACTMGEAGVGTDPKAALYQMAATILGVALLMGCGSWNYFKRMKVR